MNFPNRIICLTEETTEILYELGAENLIVGISGYTVRPKRARKEKPRVSAFSSAKIDKIIELKPDLILGFSDIQSDICSQLIKKGINVLCFNQRSVEEILNVINLLGRIINKAKKAEDYTENIKIKMDKIIDLSYKAARKLDFVNQGTVKVRIDVIRLGDNKYYKWEKFAV